LETSKVRVTLLKPPSAP